MSFQDPGFFDQVKSGSPDLAGLSEKGGASDGRAFVPEMRVRIKDLFSRSAGLAGTSYEDEEFRLSVRALTNLSQKGDLSTHLKLPTLTLAKEETGDNGLLSVDINRGLGVGAAGTATLVFANRDGKLYRSNPPEKGDGLPVRGIDNSRSALVPTLEEETFIIPGLDFKQQKADIEKRTIGNTRLQAYLAELLKRRLMGNDISSLRREAISNMRAAAFREGVDWSTGLSDKLKKDLYTLIRVEPIFDLMAHVEIDMKDVKGRWFGVFTGFISSVKDSYSPGEVPSITLECHDKSAIFGRIMTVVAASLLPEADYTTKSGALQQDVRSIFADNIDAQKVGDAVKIIVDVANTIFSAQGYIGRALSANSFNENWLNNRKKEVEDFVDESYGKLNPNFIRAGLKTSSAGKDLKGPNERVSQLRLNKDGRFWRLDKEGNEEVFKLKEVPNDSSKKTKGSKKKPKKVIPPFGITLYARLFRLWTFPGRKKDGKKASTLSYSIQDQTEYELFGEVTTAMIRKAPSPEYALDYEDYRGLSPYWPYLGVDGSGRWGLGGRKQSYLGFKGKGKDSNERGVFPDADEDSNNVPFRESGIFQYDKYIGQDSAIARFATAVIRNAWSNFMNQSVPAVDKLNMIVQNTHLDMYTTGLGDLVIALPRYNQVPLSGVDSIEAGPDISLVDWEKQGSRTKEDIDAARLIDRGDYYHGREYILSDFGLVNRTIGKTEDDKIDRVLVQSNYDLLGGIVPEELATRLTKGGVIGGEKFQGIYGNRTLTAQLSISLGDGIQPIELLERYAGAIKTKMNIRSNVLDVTYKIPRPIELGRTVLLPDNMWLYYVTRITRSWRAGQDYSESYHGEYGHPLWFHVPVPWVTISNKDEKETAKKAVRKPAPTTWEQDLSKRPVNETPEGGNFNQSVRGAFEG